MTPDGRQREFPPNRPTIQITYSSSPTCSPAELLQQFAILDVEQQNQQLPVGHKRNSPLNISFTEGNQEGDSRSDATATASPPEVTVKVLPAGSSSEHMRSSVR